MNFKRRREWGQMKAFRHRNCCSKGIFLKNHYQKRVQPNKATLCRITDVCRWCVKNRDNPTLCMLLFEVVMKLMQILCNGAVLAWVIMWLQAWYCCNVTLIRVSQSYPDKIKYKYWLSVHFGVGCSILKEENSSTIKTFWIFCVSPPWYGAAVQTENLLEEQSNPIQADAILVLSSRGAPTVTLSFFWL